MDYSGLERNALVDLLSDYTRQYTENDWDSSSADKLKMIKEQIQLIQKELNRRSSLEESVVTDSTATTGADVHIEGIPSSDSVTTSSSDGPVEGELKTAQPETPAAEESGTSVDSEPVVDEAAQPRIPNDKE